MLNGLFDTPLGKTVLANNDPETGLMFARQNMITAHEVKHCDDINELENMRRSRDRGSREQLGNVSRDN